MKLAVVNEKSVSELDMWWQLIIYAGDIFVSVVLSAIFYLVVEAPASQLVNLLFSRKKIEEYSKFPANGKTLSND